VNAAECNPPPEEQVEALWHELSRPLSAFIRRRVADEDTAEDILQDVFLRMHTRLCGLRQTGSLEAWAYQIARNAVIDSYRTRRMHQELVEELPAEEDFRDMEDLRAPLAASLRATAADLPEPYREALLLVDFEGWSQQALAEKQAVSLSGAKSRVQRARRMLRDLLLACCHFEFDARGGILDYYERCCCCQPH
jgi:RNA polymerase sigma-70 factor, ECF subfamily